MSEYKSKAKVTGEHLTDVWRETNTNLRAELDECKRQLAAHRASDADELADVRELLDRWNKRADEQATDAEASTIVLCADELLAALAQREKA